jgi:hypothetical protein
LGQIEHVQADAPIKRIALLDNVCHYLRLQTLVDEMSDSERGTLNGILHEAGAQDLTALRLKRNIERRDYAYVLV